VTRCRAIAVALARRAASRSIGRSAGRFAFSLGLTAVGQLIADIPDLFHRTFGPLGTVSDVCYVVGAVWASAR
jgi:hypothetical protein